MHNQKTILLPHTVPSLSALQRASFCWFLEYGFSEILERFGFIDDYSDTFRIAFTVDFFKISSPVFSLKHVRETGPLSYSVRIITKLAIFEKESTTNLSSLPILLAHLPLLTNEGSIYMNGVERIIVSQLTRGPGIYYSSKASKKKKVSTATLLPANGPWLDFNLIEVFRKDYPSELQLTIKIRNLEVPVYHILRLLKMTDEVILKEINHAQAFFREFWGMEDEVLLDELINYFEVPLAQVERFFYKEEAIQAVVYYNFFDPRRLFLSPLGRRQLNSYLPIKVPNTAYVLTREDIVGTVNDVINYREGRQSEPNDIDHLGNKKVRGIGELLQAQAQAALTRTHNLIRSKFAKNRSTFKQLKETSNSSFGNSTTVLHALNSLYTRVPVENSFKEFFNSSPLSQFMDQTNPLASIKQQRKISLLGSGGLTADQTRSTRVRDIHPSQYGRICAIETNEGRYAGIVNTLSIGAKFNGYGLLVAPVHKVHNRHTSPYNSVYLDAYEEQKLLVATGDQFVDNMGFIKSHYLRGRLQNEPVAASSTEVSYKASLPGYNFAVGVSLSPFLEHNDVTRMLMSSNMQRQSLGLLYPAPPIIGTGLEWQVIGDSASDLRCLASGKVIAIRQTSVIVQTIKKWKFLYTRRLCERSNQQAAVHQRICVALNEKVRIGQPLATGVCSVKGELAIGQNLMVAYLPWYGFNFEDAIIINERLVHDDIYTSLHVHVFETTVCYTELGLEELTRNLPEVSESSLSHLDDRGLPFIGAWVKPSDILCGKITPINPKVARPEVKLMRAVLSLTPWDNVDSSLRLPLDNQGRVTRFLIRQHTMTQWEAFQPGAVHLFVEVEVTQRKRIEVGDKMAGRHGNKGVISIIAPVEDMPYLHDGTPVDMVLNPLGVPSRMNVGQIYECLMGWAAETLGVRFRVTPFDEAYSHDASYKVVNKQLMRASGIAPWRFPAVSPGKVMLSDGKTGVAFQNPVTVGIAYFLKLHHVVSKKIHARSTGPYSLITQQPLKGRSKRGGQKIGEMEVWALEAYGAAAILHELLTLKSDDIDGRLETARSIMKGVYLPAPGIPETFRVLIREVQALCLELSAHKLDLTEAKLKESVKVKLFPRT